MTHPLQTKEWGEFRKEWGNEILTTEFGIITLHKIPFTKFKIGIFEKGLAPTSHMLKALRHLGKQHNLIFIKLEPNQLTNNQLTKLLIKAGALQGRRLFTPTTFWIDLTKSEEELLKSFSSKTRYNIRLAQKKRVIVKEDNSNESFEKYLELTFETAKRQGFYAHTQKYHKLMWQHLKDKIAHLLVARYKGEIISTWILFAHDGFLYYPYGASTDKYKEVMANNLMMWEAIKFGKKLGLSTFDLWGREEGKGFTKFKEGYNPKVVEFLGTWDLVTSAFYRPYKIAENIRWKILKTKSKFVTPAF